MSDFLQNGAIVYYKETGLELALDWIDDNDAPVPMPTGSTARMQVRASDSEPALAEIGTADNSIILDATSGRITLQGDPAAFAALVASTIYQYDLIVTIVSGLPRRVIGGDFIVEPTITHD